MVATRGRGWRLAPSLVAAFNQADALAPHRDHSSDGTIGDAAHRARSSDHNPEGGIVHAGDFDHDPAHGFDAHGLVRKIAARRDPRVKYLISQGQIWDPRRGWHRYIGENRHDHHAHISIWSSSAAVNDTSPWWIGVAVAIPPPPPQQGGNPMIMRRYPDGSIWLHEEDGILRSRVPTQDDANVLKLLGVPFDDYSGNPNAAKTLLAVTRDIDQV